MNESSNRVRECTRLTARESEVLKLLAEGMSSKEIAQSLFCSKRTVDFHLNRVYGKLGVSNRLQAIIRSDLMRAA